MARALAYPAVFAVLLGGGHISVKHPPVGAAKYTVHPASGSVLCSGHITENQFGQLIKHRIISELPKGNTDKYGNVYRFWKIEGGLSNAI